MMPMLSDSFRLYSLQSGTRQYKSLAYHPECDVRGTWQLFEYGQLAQVYMVSKEYGCSFEK